MDRLGVFATARGWFQTGIAAALGLTVLIRLSQLPAVLRDEAVIFGRNDPWHYRDRVHHLRETGDGLGLEAAGAETGEPLFYCLAHLWTVAGEVVGVSPDVALAILPVVLAVATVAVVGWTAHRLLDDGRVTVLAMLLLATYPGHVRYSMVGVADHHALDHLLLAAMSAAVVGLVRVSDTAADVTDLSFVRSVVSIAALAVTVALAMLAWSGAPLLLVPAAAAAVALSLRAHAGQQWAWLAALRLAAGLFAASVLASVPHFLWGWQERLATLAPALAAGGVLVVAAACRQQRLTAAGARLTLGGVGLAAVPLVAPGLASRVSHRVLEDLLGRGRIIEAAPLVHPRVLNTVAPLWYVGPLLVLVPAVGLVLWRLRDDPAWLVVGAMLAAVGALAILQLRFAGELGILLAPAAAVTLVAVGSEMSALTPPGDGTLRPSVAAAPAVVVAVALVAASAIVAVGLGPALFPGDTQVAAAQAIDDRAGDGAYVLTAWGDSRGYNGLVSGDSNRYTYALRHYEPVVRGERPVPARVDYVVVDERSTPEQFDRAWHSGQATRVWSQRAVAVWEVTN